MKLFGVNDSGLELEGGESEKKPVEVTMNQILIRKKKAPKPRARGAYITGNPSPKVKHEMQRMRILMR